jgi:hypothetical protein
MTHFRGAWGWRTSRSQVVPNLVVEVLIFLVLLRHLFQQRASGRDCRQVNEDLDFVGCEFFWVLPHDGLGPGDQNLQSRLLSRRGDAVDEGLPRLDGLLKELGHTRQAGTALRTHP